ncbi:hypothetical protein ACN28S_23190 [Cystobacter fuscus]
MATQLKVGGEVDAFCTRCRLTLAHTILAMVGTKIARVRCNTCNGDHAFRSAPGTTDRPSTSSRSSGGGSSTPAPHAPAARRTRRRSSSPSRSSWRARTSPMPRATPPRTPTRWIRSSSTPPSASAW